MTEVQGAGISRRRIVQGAAWATPAVLIATAAPAAASSTVAELFANFTRSGQTVTVDFTSDVPVGSGSTLVSTLILTYAPGAGNSDPFAGGATTGYIRHSWNHSGSPKTLTITVAITVAENGTASFSFNSNHLPTSGRALGTHSGSSISSTVDTNFSV